MKVLGVGGVLDMGRISFNSREFRNSLQVTKTGEETVAPKASGRQNASSYNFSPSDVSRVLKQESFDPMFVQDQASTTSILTVNRKVNLLSHSDAIAQEMMQNLQPSMSLSGDASRDITLPDHSLGTSAKYLVRLEELADRFPFITEQKEIRPPSPKDPESPPMPPNEPPIPPPILVPPKAPVIFEPRQTNIERSLAVISPDQIVASNRPSDLPLPLMLLPEDMPITASPTELRQLEDRKIDIASALSEKSRNIIRTDQREGEIVEKYQAAKDAKDDPITYQEQKRNIGEFQLEEEVRRPQPDPLTYQDKDILSILGAMQLQP